MRIKRIVDISTQRGENSGLLIPDQNLNIFLKSSPMTYCQMLMIVLSLRLSMPLRMSFVSLGASASSEDIAYVGSAVGTAWGHGDLDFHMCSIPPERRVSPK